MELEPAHTLDVKSIREHNSPASDALQITSVRSCTQENHFIPLYRLINELITKRRIYCNENKTREEVLTTKQAVICFMYE
jgi:hypothetical protein